MNHDFILIDRSGSMATNWKETMGAVNAYVEKLYEDKVDTGVTIACFDRIHERMSFDLLRDKIALPMIVPITEKDAAPRGNTPLNDAIGRIVALAKAGDYEKLALIIVTDGEENASREVSTEKAKALLAECRAKGWQVIMLGADYENMAQATSYGNAGQHTVAMAAGSMRDTMTMAAAKRGLYGSGAAQDMAFTDEEKKQVSKRS